jgi:hypothetical protein
MRPTILLALVAALLFAPAAGAAGPIQIIRDCEDDGVLQGDYSASELRKAREELPTDVDEYSDCRDVLSRALDARASRGSNGGDGDGTGITPGTGGGTGTGAAPPGQSNADPSRVSDSAAEAGKLPAAYTPQDHIAVNRAAAHGGEPINLNGHKVAPGGRLVATVGRNDLPVTLIVVLALLGAAALAAVAPAVRRRAFAHRPS